MADFARSSHPAVQAQLDRLSKLSPAGDRLGLERISTMLERLGRPQDALPPVFHVAGTNGKGSTVAFLRGALEASGNSVHVFTSPHLVRFNERIRIAGRLIDDDELAQTLEEVVDAGTGIEPSFFEVATIAAFLAFARTPAEACILEVGLGGRLDATNVIERPLVTQLYPPAIGQRIEEIARDRGATWLPRGGVWDGIVRQGKLRYSDERGELDLPLPRLPGRHQAMNAALAVAMLRHQDAFRVAPSALSAAIGWTDWPARLQHLAPGPLVGDRDVWLDGGHNPSAARQIASFVKHRFNDGRPLHIVFASLATKDPAGMLEPFEGLVARVHAVPIPDHSCFAPVDLVEVAGQLGFSADPHDSVEEALAAIPPEARVMIFGSLYLAGVVLAANDQVPD